MRLLFCKRIVPYILSFGPASLGLVEETDRKAISSGVKIRLTALVQS